VKKYARNPAIISKTIDDEQILLNVETGDYFGLNEIGSDLWELIDGSNDLNGIIHRLLEIYEVEESVLAPDVTEFLNTLIDKNIIYGD